MKLIRYTNESGESHWGDWVGPRSARRLTGDPFAEIRLSEKTDSINRLLPPVTPPNIFAIGRNYRDHAKEMQAKELPKEPLIFMKATTSLAGSEDPIVIPAAAPSEIDYEAELAVIIGKRAVGISESQALDYVFGYTCANDVSARDCQRIDKQWVRGKSFDTFCPIGPAIIPQREIGPDNLKISSILNGQVMQNANTSEMIFSVAYLVSFLSRQFTLLPGTLILTGTPAGVGAARTPPVFLKKGDVITIEIERIGSLKSHVVAQESL